MPTGPQNHGDGEEPCKETRPGTRWGTRGGTSREQHPVHDVSLMFLSQHLEENSPLSGPALRKWVRVSLSHVTLGEKKTVRYPGPRMTSSSRRLEVCSSLLDPRDRQFSIITTGERVMWGGFLSVSPPVFVCVVVSTLIAMKTFFRGCRLEWNDLRT